MDDETITGGEVIARVLKAHKVGPIFGMGGFQLLPFYDAARRLGLNHNLINDERCGIFAADAYARVSGRVGVCDATLGPGATNLVTGLVESFNAGTPIVVLVGDTHRMHSWKNMTQETRQADLLAPACKEVIRIEMVERIAEQVDRAFRVATSGRPGPVVVIVPEDVCHAEVPADTPMPAIDPRHSAAPAIRCRPARADVAQAAAALREAERPIMLCGGGVLISQAWEAVTRLAEEQSIPVAHTMSGKGAIPCVHPLSAGLFGRYDRIANALIEASDCILVVGCKLGEIATKRYTVPAAGKFVIHLDIVAEEFGRTRAPDLTLWGDAREGLADLREALGSDAAAVTARRAGYGAEVADRMAKWRGEVSGNLTSADRPVHMARLIQEMNENLPEEAILIADGGFAAHWSGLLYDTKRAGRGFVPDRGLASIGYGLPGAIGAAVAADGRPVFALTGDGGFNMTLGELETARRMGLKLAMVVVNNAASGYVKALQHLMFGPQSYQSSDLAEMNYAEVARSMGCHGIRVEDPDAVGPALREALNVSDGPVVIDVVVTRDPAQMLPAVDSRIARVKKGDRIA